MLLGPSNAHMDIFVSVVQNSTAHADWKLLVFMYMQCSET